MKKHFTKFCAYSLCATLLSTTLTGCVQIETVNSDPSTKEVTSVNQTAFASSIKAKYAQEEKTTYSDPIYNVEKDHVFTYDNIAEDSDFWNLDEYDCFSVYYDSDLTQAVDVTIEKDLDAKTVSITPNLTFTFEQGKGSLSDDHTWGSRSKFWLVQNVDLQTGKQLEKPIVTVFTTKEDMNTPTLQQSLNENGFYSLSWDAVENADYYEVYRYASTTDSAFLEVTTENTSCGYDEFETEQDRAQHFEETYEGTEVDVDQNWHMNNMLNVDDAYFVVAKTNDGKHSGMSNICMLSEIASQIPLGESDDFPDEYEGDSILDLPAYVDMEMLDGSTGQFLITYQDAKITLLRDNSIMIECKIKNLPIEMQSITFRGMDWDAFRDEKESLLEREEKLSGKSATTQKNINVPYLPDSDTETDVEETTETEDPYAEETTEPEMEEPEAQETMEPEIEDPETEETTEPEIEDVEETTEPEADEPKSDSNNELQLSDRLQETVVANSALSEWIAVNMLAYQNEISLADFPEVADSELLRDALLEAYTQNPLIGIMSSADYDYDRNCLLVEYVYTKEETEHMQEESLNKAAEIVKNIITNDMNDFEKEEAINRYLCENGSYNDKIMDYINSDGTIDPEATHDFAHSFTPYGILVENLGVCESYSEAFLLLAKEAGLHAVIETGTLDGVNHEWNRIQLDNAWYTIDTTNNDSEVFPNIYFNLPDDLAGTRLLQDNDAFLDQYVGNYTSEGMEHEYYTKNNLYTEDSEEAADLLAGALENSETACVRMPADLDEASIQEIAQNAVNKANVTSCKFYYSTGLISLIKE